MTPEFSRILASAYQGGVDVSLRELVLALGLPVDDVLGSAMQVNGVLASMGLALEPDITRGDYDLRRALGAQSSLSEAVLKGIIVDEEHRGVEFKSTLICDIRALRETPSRSVRSEAVTHSALKTICAFANSGGGRLLIGVEDDQKICGLDPDLEVMQFNRDRWEGHLRSLIQTRFWQGRVVNSFVKVQYVAVDGLDVAVIDVVGRKDSTFIKHARDDRHEFYIRQGNRSVALDMQEFELHLRQ